LECRAQPIEFSMARKTKTNRLLEVNRRLLWNCDVLIAIWDGKPAQGTGGNRLRHYSGPELGLPVIHIEAAPRDGNGHHNQLHMFHVLEPTSAAANGEKITRAAFAG